MTLENSYPKYQHSNKIYSLELYNINADWKLYSPLKTSFKVSFLLGVLANVCS